MQLGAVIHSPRQTLGPLLSVGLLLSFVAPEIANAQGGRKVTTLTALSAHPIFFHLEQVILHADAESEQLLTYLVDEKHRLLALNMPLPPKGARERFEVIGVFYDVGRLEREDSRLANYPIERLSKTLLDKPWPGVGELPLLIASSVWPAHKPTSATLRTVALDPELFVGNRITVTGRFRGRNLYGDLPTPPHKSRHDFVLASADAAVWVVGKEPQGKDFELDVSARVDTGRWLKVTGTARFDNGMVLIEAGTIRLAERPNAPSLAPLPPETPPGPPPEVIFSTPLPDESDVPRDTTVRIQFSRDMDPKSFQGLVNLNYVGVPSVDVARMPPMTIHVEYLARNRVLEIRFEAKLEQYRTVTVKLLEGITASDGMPLQPWSLSFFTGA